MHNNWYGARYCVHEFSNVQLSCATDYFYAFRHPPVDGSPLLKSSRQLPRIPIPFKPASSNSLAKALVRQFDTLLSDLH
jgi:hypothetical protein